MKSQTEAEELATKKVLEFTKDCDNKNDAGNALMKILSVTGQLIRMTHGHEEALAIVEVVAVRLSKLDNADNLEKIKLH